MEAKTNISQPAEYLGYWEETYKNDLVNDVMPFWLKYGIDKGTFRFHPGLCLQSYRETSRMVAGL